MDKKNVTVNSDKDKKYISIDIMLMGEIDLEF